MDAATKTINPSCIDPVAARLIDLYPLPNVPGTGFFNNNFITNGILKSDIDQFDIRSDYNVARGRDSGVRPLQLPEHQPRSSRRCWKIRSPPATSPATS